jgi:uncharacterized protein (TIGR00251 family)
MTELFKEYDSGIIFSVYLTPGSKTEEIRGVLIDEDDRAAIKIAVTAKPKENKANEALVRFLSSVFEAPRSAITIKSGHTSRKKTIVISDYGIIEIPDRLIKILETKYPTTKQKRLF